MKTKRMPIALGIGVMLLAGVLVALGAPVSFLQETGKPATDTQQTTAHEKAHRVRIAGNVMAANLVDRVEPQYPKEAKKKHLQGDVRIRIVVDEEGKVIKTDTLSGHHILAKAAAEAVRHWRYQPTLLNGEPIQVESEVELHFHRHKWRVD